MGTLKEMLTAGAAIVGLLTVCWFVLAEGTDRPSATRARPPTEFGAAHIKDGPVLGCIDDADLKRALLVQGDRAAAIKELTDSQRCVMLEDNEKLFIEHADFSGKTKVRRPGEAIMYWTISDRITLG